MPNSPNGPIRRAQLIVPFGTGAMLNVPGGTSLVIAGLDYWFKSRSSDKSLDVSEFQLEEWRLQKLLKVNHLRLPPDYREPFRSASDLPNLKITVPAFRFPSWHFCPSCKLLTKRSVYERGVKGKIKCPECEDNKKTRYLVQVPFIAICENGHLNDFPWREWVHRSITPTCNGKLRLKSTGSATLGGQKVICDECKAGRNLAGITSASEISNTTTLSSNLSKGEEFICPGGRPWFGPDSNEDCLAQVRGSLRSALNVYFSHVRSSLYLPRTNNTKVESILPLYESPPISTAIKTLTDLEASNDDVIRSLRKRYGKLLIDFTDEELIIAFEAIKEDIPPDEIQDLGEDLKDDPLKFRKEEYDVLKIQRK